MIPAVLRRPTAALAGVVVLVSGGLTAAYASRPAPDRAGTATAAAATRTPVQTASAVCPEPLGNVNSITRVVASAAAAAGVADSRSGTLTVTDLAAGTRPRLTTDRPGYSVGMNVKKTLAPSLVRASGALAPGLAAIQTTRTSAGALRGLASVTCATASTTSWFVGSGAAVGRRGAVYLTNPSSTPAVVDVTLWGPKGQLTSPASTGIALGPGARKVLALDALAPGTADFGIRVHARSGRVAAALRDTEVAGLDTKGADWVPVAAEPARHVVVPGVTGGDGSRVLHVLVPGSSDAIVKLQLVTPDGSFAPEGKDVLEIPAGTVVSVDLTKVLGGDAAAVRLDADVPVTASLIARRQGKGSPLGEFSWTAATPAVGEVAVLADGSTLHGQYSDLMLSAPGAAARVRLSPRGYYGKALPARTITVPEGSTVRVPLSSVTTEAAYALLLEPQQGSGPVYAARSVSQIGSRGPLITAQPLGPVTRTVPVPGVRVDYGSAAD